MNSNKKTARIAGFLFLILIISGVFAEYFIRQKIIVSGNPGATVQNIINSEWLFRLGIVSDLFMSAAFFFFSLVLYHLFKTVSKYYASAMVLCVTISCSILCINMLNQIAPLVILSGADYLSNFQTEQLHGLVTFFLKMHTNGYYIAQLFFGLYLFPLGLLVYKSGFLPKIIGVFLMMGCFGDLIDLFRFFLFPDFESVILNNITLPADIGEFSFCLWLLIKGVKEVKPISKEVAGV
ncbi:DUF4386 domain-containing protein [Cytophagales bacterium RKSG123]|nr:DUF4386 domain-containing protein [Xanthovirga aplysinae]